MNDLSRRRFLISGASAVGLVIGAAACASDDSKTDTADTTQRGATSSSQIPSDTHSRALDAWSMPSEDTAHERTWMCWPSSDAVWGNDLAEVQQAVARVALAIAGFEPVTLLARRNEFDAIRSIVGDKIDLLEGPVDDLWARDTLPCFLTKQSADGAKTLAAGHVQFNGWGNKQAHDGDAQLAALVANHLGVELVESGLFGEGGGIEVDGAGSILAAKSSWVNKNRNPQKSVDEVAASLTKMLGGERVIWIDGLAGADITDGHIDTLARFVDEETILVDTPAVDDPGDNWVGVAKRTRETVHNAKTLAGKPYEIVAITQPTSTRVHGDQFLSTYMNYYVCDGAVIMPEFGDTAMDAAAVAIVQRLFADRKIVTVNIDPIAAGGGGIHCATQQQPKTR